MKTTRSNRILLGLLICVGAFAGALAQSTAPPAEAPSTAVGLDSPRGTMFTFLDAVNRVREGDRDALAAAIVCLDTSGLEGDAAAQRAARDLWRALNRIRKVNRQELPDRGSLGEGEITFVYFPRPFDREDEAIVERADATGLSIEMARGADGNWRFSRRTVAEIGELADRLEPLERKVPVGESALVLPDWLTPLLPAGLLGDFVGVAYWQWLGLALMIFAGLVVDLVVRTLVRPVFRRIPRRFGGTLDPEMLNSAVRMIGLFAGAMVWVVLLPLLALGGTLEPVLLAAARAFAVLAGTFAGFRVADVAATIFMHRAERSESKFDDILVPLVRKTAKLFILALGIIYGAQSLYINIVPLITGLGIGGLAFAFAAKDTIENFFGSVAVILDRPFEVGDWVVIDNVEGTVEELGFRSTRIRTFYDSQVTVPNAALVRATVDNLGRRVFRRWKTTLGVQYDTAPEKLLAFTEGLRELVRHHPYTRKDYFQVWCNDFGASSIDVLVYVFFETPDWSTELRERERLLVDIVRLADRLGVAFAFPTQTLHLFQEQHGSLKSVHAIPGEDHDALAAADGTRAARELVASQSWRSQRPGAVSFGSPPPADGPQDRGGDG